MKKSLITFLALLLALCGLFCATALGEAAALPAVGDRIGGFVVQSVTPVDVLGATAVLFEHEKNGAKLLYMASDDPNCSFDITFQTPTLDETGKAHVFEHMTICGSQKYPDANLFFPFSNQTYNTYVNACTYHGMTSYPLSSLSEEQLMTMMDYYLSGVFDPLVKTEPRMVSREAWRYELDDAEAPLTIAGTVYSEMQGALTIDRLAAANDMTTMFQNGLTAHVSGGRPEAIRTLRWEDLIAFHDTYYHPSNALIVLYGALDYRAFITYIDTEYISAFDRQSIDVERGQVEPYTDTLYAVYDVPVESDAPTENGTYLCYSFASNDMTMEDELGMEILAGVISNGNSPVMRLLDERLPGVSTSVSVDIDRAAPTFLFFAMGANESDRDTFVQAIDEGLAQMKAEGISQDDFEATISRNKLALMLTAEDSALGVDASMQTALYWTYFQSLDYFNLYEKTINEMTLDRLTELFHTYVTDNAYRGVTVTRPAAGLAEENAAKLNDELAQVKAAMTDEEVQAMVADSTAFAQWSAATPDPALLGKLVNMTVDKLPETVPEYEVVDEAVDGVRSLTAVAEVGDVAQTTIHLDVSTLPLESLSDACIYVNLLGKIGTAEHTKEELDTLIYRYLGVLGADLWAESSHADGVPDQYSLALTTLGLPENAEKGYALLREILFDTDVSQTGDIKTYLSELRSGILTSVENPLSLQFSRCAAVFYDVDAFNARVCGFGMFDDIQAMIALADSDPALLTARLEAAREELLNSYNATVLCAGSQNAVNVFTQEAKKLLALMPSREGEKTDYSALRLHMTSEAIVNNSTVHMNMLLAPSDGFSGKDVPIAALLGDKYMMPQLRNAMGAYGAYISFDEYTNEFYTYRDPNLADTFDAFSALPEFLRSMELTQADVDNYIIGSYGQFVFTSGKLSQALTVVNNAWMGLTNERRLQRMREAKATTVADVYAIADKLENLLTNGVRSSSGAASIIEENKELFDSVVKLEVK